MNRYTLIYIFVFIFFRLYASDYQALNSWYHPHSVSAVGVSSSIISAESDRLNPAFIYNNEKLINLSFVQYPSEITSQLAQIFYPKKEYVLVATIRHISYGIFKGYDEEGITTSNYSAADTWLSCSIAKPFYSENVQLGASLGYFYSNISNISSILLTATTGLSLKIPKYKMNVGIALRNFAIEIKPYSDNKNSIPILLNLSTTKKLAYLPLSISIDTDFDTDNKLKNMRLAGVITLTNNINCTLGTSTNRINQSSNINFFKDLFADTGFGFSISTKQYVIDLGTYLYGMGGTVFSMGIGLKI